MVVEVDGSLKSHVSHEVKELGFALRHSELRHTEINATDIECLHIALSLELQLCGEGGQCLCHHGAEICGSFAPHTGEIDDVVLAQLTFSHEGQGAR